MRFRATSRPLLATITSCAMITAGAVLPNTVGAAPNHTVIPQETMTAVEADSVEPTGEGANGALDLVLDGNQDTYWHTKWAGGVDPLPHWFVVQLGSEPVDLARVDLTPRQSSNGSGRVGDYELFALDIPECTNEAFADASPVATGSFGGEVAANKEVRSITLDQPVTANCVKVVYKSSWGGTKGTDPISPPERVASLAEFNAYTLGEEAPDAGDGVLDISVPEGAPAITDGNLIVRTHPEFPQIVDYRVGEAQLAGQFGDALSQVTINGTAQDVEVGEPTATEASVSYPLTFPALPGVSMNAVISVREGVLTYTLSDIVDPDQKVARIAIPGLAMTSVRGSEDGGSVFAAKMSVNRVETGDVFIDDIAGTPVGSGTAWMAVANNDALAAGFETNAIGDNTTEGGGGGAARYAYEVKDIDGVRVASVGPVQWTYRAGAVSKYDDGSGIGVDDDPMIQVKITDDANMDAVVDWQDGAIAARDILTPIIGAEDVADTVITRIPFNIVSQATHPFLRTLDDTKRISLATDNLGQQALLKGYQAEGHDSAQGDYDGHYNHRAGGLEDLKTLVDEGVKWNTTFGIHVNATETYSEAKVFSEDLLHMPPRKAWGWMNQSYYMNNQKDLATGNVLDRMAKLREVFPADSNLNWLYWDVYYPRGWEGDRFSGELIDAGWRISSEWSDALPRYNTWSHWANDENYGGQTNKGINSQLIRFVQNSYKDTWNPDPMLGNANVEEFEGWVGKTDYNPFILNVWQRNLPTKFLQQSNIMTWEDGRITFENGTEVTSDLTSIDGRTLPNDRTITFDGATVFDQGSYLLPWNDGGDDRLYYWNATDAAATWTLTDAWKSQQSLTLFELTDTGRQKVADIPVNDGKITLPATKADTAYVLYPTSAVPAVQAPDWGQGSNIADPGFFSGTLDAYDVKGNATIVKTDRGNFQAELGTEASSISQEITLPAGSHSVWAWVEIEPGKTRDVEVRAEGPGVMPAHLQPGAAGEAVTAISDSGAMNATASDEKLRTFFQRVPVRITTDGSPFTFTVAAATGDAAVAIDDLRAVAQTMPIDDATTDQTIVFEDFEDVDTGYWPFVTGRANTGGDARTQLAELHEPYSQSGWYGLVNGSDSTATEGQKYLDNVLDGTWSLLAHQENGGMILRTTSASVPLRHGHNYRVSFDYQAAYADDYELVLGVDKPGSDGWTENVTQRWSIPAARGAGWKDADGNAGSGTQRFVREFAITDARPSFLGVIKRGGAVQGDLVIDNFRVEELGVSPMVSMDAKPTQSDVEGTFALDVSTTVSIVEGDATDVTHSLTGLEGWAIEKVGSPAVTTINDETSSVQHWIVHVPKGGEAGDLLFEGSWTHQGEAGSDQATHRVDPSNFPLMNPVGGEELSVVDVSSEETVGEGDTSGFAEAAIDGDTSTYWHTEWSGQEAQPPHHITLAVNDAEACSIEAFEYTARQSATNGKAKGYEIYVSSDGENWGDPVAAGELPDTSEPQRIYFDQPAEGKYVKFVQLTSQAGNVFGGAAEIRLGATCDFPTVTANTAGTKLVGNATNVWGSAPGKAGEAVIVEMMHDGAWTQIGEGTVRANDTYVVELAGHAEGVGTHQIRVRVGEATSETVELTRIPRATSWVAAVTAVGRNANAWGYVGAEATVSTQVKIPGKGWVTSQKRNATAGTLYIVPLTYGQNNAGTLQWRVVVRYDHGEVEYLEAHSQRRIAAPTAATAGQAPVGSTANVWGTVDTDQPLRVWTEVQVPDGRWVKSQERMTKPGGGYVIPLTYGQTTKGELRWRVAADHPGVGVLRSDEFTFVRR